MSGVRKINRELVLIKQLEEALEAKRSVLKTDLLNLRGIGSKRIAVEEELGKTTLTRSSRSRIDGAILAQILAEKGSDLDDPRIEIQVKIKEADLQAMIAEGLISAGDIEPAVSETVVETLRITPSHEGRELFQQIMGDVIPRLESENE